MVLFSSQDFFMLKYKFIRFQLNCSSYEYKVKHIALLGVMFYFCKGGISRILKPRKVLIFKELITTLFFMKVCQMVNSLKLEEKMSTIELTINYL